MKKVFILLIVFLACQCLFAQHKPSIILLKDSIGNQDTGFVYIYKIIKKIGSEKQVLFTLKTKTISINNDFTYKSKIHEYICFSLYDEPTGILSLIIYYYKGKKLYQSKWFDDNATGDSIIKEKTNFNKQFILVKEHHPPKTYKVKLDLIINVEN